MNLRLTTFFLFFISIPALYSQITDNSKPPSGRIRTKSVQLLPSTSFVSLDHNKLLKEDEEFPQPLRYGVCRPLNIDLTKDGTQELIPGEGKIWRYLVISSGAKGIGFNFRKFRIPEGAGVWLYNPTYERCFGAVGAENNNPDNAITFSELPGDTVIIEYFEPENSSFHGTLFISEIIHAYRDQSIKRTGEETGTQSGNIDARCPVAYPYWEMKHSVCKITFNDTQYSYLCTAYLINNTANDGTPYLATANHCISNNAFNFTLVATFNYEDQDCSVSGLQYKSLGYCSFLYTVKESDFTLLKLISKPTSDYQPVYAGWDITGTANEPVIAIHHPDGKSKVISISSRPVSSNETTISWNVGSSSPKNSHWEVKFTTGATAGGSSGCPGFDKNSHVIGQLHGGDSKADYFGKLSYTYHANPDLFKKYLDPRGTDTYTLDQYIPSSNYPEPFFDANIKSPCIGGPVKLLNRTVFKADTFEWEVRNSITGSSKGVEYIDGTTPYSFEPVVRFNEKGTFNIRLRSGISKSIQSETYRYNMIVSDDTIRLSTTGIPADGILCGNLLKDYRISSTGALDYSYIFDENTGKMDIVKDSSVLHLTLRPGMETSGNFSFPLQIIGSHGSCTTENTYDLSVNITPGNEPEFAEILQEGLNGPYSNRCTDFFPGEPHPNGGDCFSQRTWCSSNGDSILSNTMWFRITAPHSGRLNIKLTGFDAQMALYKANDPSDFRNNPGNIQLIAANDNLPNTKEPEILPVNVTPGEDYWLQVDGGVNSPYGTFSLLVLQDAISYYPNPTDGELTIEVGFKKSENIRIEITGLQGRVIRSLSLNKLGDGDKINVDLSDLPRGIYLLRFYSSTHSGVSKILKM